MKDDKHPSPEKQWTVWLCADMENKDLGEFGKHNHPPERPPTKKEFFRWMHAVPYTQDVHILTDVNHKLPCVVLYFEERRQIWDGSNQGSIIGHSITLYRSAPPAEGSYDRANIVRDVCRRWLTDYQLAYCRIPQHTIRYVGE